MEFNIRIREGATQSQARSNKDKSSKKCFATFPFFFVFFCFCRKQKYFVLYFSWTTSVISVWSSVDILLNLLIAKGKSIFQSFLGWYFDGERDNPWYIIHSGSWQHLTERTREKRKNLIESARITFVCETLCNISFWHYFSFSITFVSLLFLALFIHLLIYFEFWHSMPRFSHISAVWLVAVDADSFIQRPFNMWPFPKIKYADICGDGIFLVTF